MPPSHALRRRPARPFFRGPVKTLSRGPVAPLPVHGFKALTGLVQGPLPVSPAGRPIKGPVTCYQVAGAVLLMSFLLSENGPSYRDRCHEQGPFLSYQGVRLAVHLSLCVIPL